MGSIVVILNYSGIFFLGNFYIFFVAFLEFFCVWKPCFLYFYQEKLSFNANILMPYRKKNHRFGQDQHNVVNKSWKDRKYIDYVHW